jgi:hypothetical protein
MTETIMRTYASTAADYCYSAYGILSGGVPSPLKCKDAAEELRRAADLVARLAQAHVDKADSARLIAEGVAAQMARCELLALEAEGDDA